MFFSPWQQIQRSLRTSDAERTEAQERVSELSTTNSALQSGKRKAEQALSTLQEEFEELENDAKENSDKLRKTTELSARLQSENSSQKEQLTSLERAKTTLDQQVKELSSRLDEEVANATKSAKKEALKLQQRVR